MLSVSIAIAGGLITLLGRWLNTAEQRNAQRQAYLWGAALLCVGAALERDMILTAFEVIVVIGCIIPFTKLTRIAAAACITTGVILTTLGLALFGHWKIFTFASVGYIGLLTVALGFAMNSNRWLLAGSVIMTAYAGTNAVLDHSALSAVFAVLNLIFFGLTLKEIRSGSHQA